MHQCELAEMAHALNKAGLLGPTQVDPAIRVLTAHWADRIAIVWSVEDVLSVRPGLSEQQAAEVLQEVLHNHDATRGVTWDTLEATADALFGYGAGASDDEDEDDDDEDDVDPVLIVDDPDDE